VVRLVLCFTAQECMVSPSLSFSYFARCKLFQKIDLTQPRLRLVHERPFIFTVPGFFSSAECAALRAKAAPALAPQSFDDEVVRRQRSSMGCSMRNEEVPTLRARLAALANVSLTQMQPLKVSRYTAGDRFDVHTDAVRGDLRGRPASPDDWWADRERLKHGVVGAPISGANRIATIFVFLNTVERGGRTRWRWTNHDAALGGSHGTRFYERPSHGAGRTDVENGSGVDVSVKPEEGLAVIHFPATLPAHGGATDFNAYHEAEAAIDEKWVAQQFIWSHPRLDWRRVLDVENHEPTERRDGVTI